MPRTIIDTPIGTLALHSWDDRLVQIRWASGANDAGEPPSSADARDPVLADACRQLRAFFDRKLSRFDLPLAPSPSPRGEALRTAIAAIPYGQTASYGEVARIAGSGPRALGQACARNPFPIIIPCHRVLAARGALGHYSGGRGVETKLALLRLEAPEFQPHW